MDEPEFIAEVSKHVPEGVRTLAQIAREGRDASVRRDAIDTLFSRRLITTRQPSDEELVRIAKMTDQDITALLQKASN